MDGSRSNSFLIPSPDEDQMIPDDENFTIVEEIKTNDKGQKVKVR